MSKQMTTFEKVTAAAQVAIAVVVAGFTALEYLNHKQERIEQAWSFFNASNGTTTPLARNGLASLAKSGVDLSYIELDDRKLAGVRLTDGVNLIGARFDNADLRGATIEARLAGSGFRCARVDSLKLENRDPEFADFRATRWDGAADGLVLDWKGKVFASSVEALQRVREKINANLEGELAIALALKRQIPSGKVSVQFEDSLPSCLFDRLIKLGKSPDQLCNGENGIKWDGGSC